MNGHKRAVELLRNYATYLISTHTVAGRAELVAEVEGTIAALETRHVCEWIEDSGYNMGNVWNTECGEDFQPETGTPVGNRFAFCPYCGGKLVEVAEWGDSEDHGRRIMTVRYQADD